MVAISYNSDIGDAWEYADDPLYPAKFADQSIRMGVNYIIYAMSHWGQPAAAHLSSTR